MSLGIGDRYIHNNFLRGRVESSDGRRPPIRHRRLGGSSRRRRCCAKRSSKVGFSCFGLVFGIGVAHRRRSTAVDFGRIPRWRNKPRSSSRQGQVFCPFVGRHGWQIENSQDRSIEQCETVSIRSESEVRVLQHHGPDSGSQDQLPTRSLEDSNVLFDIGPPSIALVIILERRTCFTGRRDRADRKSAPVLTARQTGKVIELRPPLAPKRMSREAKGAYVIVAAVGRATADQERVLRWKKQIGLTRRLDPGHALPLRHVGAEPHQPGVVSHTVGEIGIA